MCVFIIEIPFLCHEVPQFHHEQMRFSVQWQQASRIVRNFQYTIVYEAGNCVVKKHQEEFNESIIRCVWPMQPDAGGITFKH